MRKGQAQTEYLLILAVVVIIALIVVGVVRGFTETSAGGIEGARSRLEWNAKDVVLTGASIYPDGAGAFIVINNANYPIKITQVSVGGPEVAQPNPETIQVGAKKTIKLVKGTAKPGDSGSEYAFDVSIKYAHAEESSIVNTVKGKISGIYTTP